MDEQKSIFDIVLFAFSLKHGKANEKLSSELLEHSIIS